MTTSHRTEISRIDELQDHPRTSSCSRPISLGRHEEFVAELEQFVTQRPLRERPRAQLMLALYRSGRQQKRSRRLPADARRALAEELGIDPSRALQELERAMLNQDARLDAAVEPSDGRDARRADWLPASS